MKIAALVLIGLMSQAAFAGETKFSFRNRPFDKAERVAFSKLAQRTDIPAEIRSCVSELKSKLVASPKFRSIRHLVKEVTFSDDWAPLPEQSFGIQAMHAMKFWSLKPKANAFLMNFSFAGTLCQKITVKQIDEEIDDWLARYAIDTATQIQAIENYNERYPEKAQSIQNRKAVESVPADPRAGRIDDVRRRIHATEADGGVDTGRIR